MTELMVEGVTPEWTLTDRLRKAREFRGLEQAQLADLIGVHRRSIVNYEVGRTTPRRPQLIAWAFATGVSLEWIETGECAVRDSNPEPADYGFGDDGGDSENWLCRRCGCEVDQGATLCDGCVDELQAVAA